MGPFRIDKEGPLNAADMFGEVMFTLQTHHSKNVTHVPGILVRMLLRQHMMVLFGFRAKETRNVAQG